MKWLYKLENKYSKYALHNIILYIVLGNLMVYLAMMVAPSANIYSLLVFHWPSILQGQVWRLFTFIFVMTPQSPIFMAIALYVDYIVGNILERSMGAFKFNIYILLGIIITAVSGIISHYIMLLLPMGELYAAMNFITGEQLLYSLFLIFALMYPESEMRFMFVVPLKAKYLAVFYLIIVGYTLFTGTWGVRVAIIAALINFMIFFGNKYIKNFKRDLKYKKARKQWRDNNRY